MNRTHFIFVLAGGAGFVTEALIIRVGLEVLELHPAYLRLISLPAAVSVTWWINRNWAFKQNAAASLTEIFKYFQVNIVAQSVNFFVFVLLSFVFDIFKTLPELALIIGSLISLLISFKLYSSFVFKNTGYYRSESHQKSENEKR